MKSFLNCVMVLALLLFTHASARAQTFQETAADQWHQFRGPLATGEAPHATPPTEWSEEKNVKWKTELPGPGSSTPIVWKNRIFVLATRPTEDIDESIPTPEDQPNRPFGIKFENRIFEFIVLCLDRETGEEIWRQVARRCVPFQGTHPDNNFASGTPTTDGRYLYVPFGSQGYYCYGLDGKLIWERDLGNVETRLSFGEGASLTIAGKKLIIVRDNENQSYIEVLNTTDGTTLWRRDRDEPSAWATPLVIRQGNSEYVVTNASNRVRTYDLDTGDLIWECGGQVSNVTPSPVHLGGTVYCASGYRGSALQAIEVDSKGDITDTDQVTWSLNKDTPYIPSLLLYRGHVYFTKSLNGIVSSVSTENGQIVLEATRLPNVRAMYASPVAANGYIYLFGRDGQATVIKAGETFEVVSENRLDDRVDASPALVGKQLFVRGLKALYCLEASD